MLPGAGEFVLGTQVYQSSDGFGSWFPENVHTANGATDFNASLAQLNATLPNRSAVSLVVAWFGTDLRAGNCQIVPKVESATKQVKPVDWAVAGQTRATAALVSQIDPATLDPTGLGASAPTSAASAAGTVPAFGGTPSDDTVIQAIQAMNADGLRVQFYPFVMMDVPPGNGLQDPYGSAQQAPFPWRGRITCFPGPGQPGTADKTAAAATQVNAFFAQYGPMVLHYAQLCVQAGGVDAFVIGSELVGLTQLRSGPGDAAYPAVAALKSLAAQVKATVGAGCRVGYAADWTVLTRWICLFFYPKQDKSQWHISMGYERFPNSFRNATARSRPRRVTPPPCPTTRAGHERAVSRPRRFQLHRPSQGRVRSGWRVRARRLLRNRSMASGCPRAPSPGNSDP